MKKFCYQLSFLLLTMTLTMNSTLFAQQTENTVKITIVTKDGKTITKEMQIEDGEMPTDFDALDGIDANNISSVDVEVLGKSTKSCESKCKSKSKCKTKKEGLKNGGSSFHFDGWDSEEFAAKRRAMRERRSSWGNSFGHSPKPMLGVYVDESYNGEGLKLDNVIQGKGAADAGLQRGDIITKIGKVNVRNVEEVSNALGEYEVGDKVCVKYTRAGASKTGNIILTGNRPQFRKRYHYSYEEEKIDPCKVFIGVYTSKRKEGGVKITSIIEDTPAANMDLKKGDIILEMDGNEVNSQPELVSERDRNESGDNFKLTILRDGKRKKVRGKFKACEEKPEITDISQPKIINPSSELQYESFEAYPNPTFGPVTISFEGEAIPTTFRITDVTGKVVFEEYLQNFNGRYTKQLELKNRAVPGSISLTVIQNGKAVSKNIVLLNRA